MHSNVDGDVPSLSSLILHFDESTFNLRDEQTRDVTRNLVTLGVENDIYFARRRSRVSRTHEAELMQSVTLPATCKRTRARVKVLAPKGGSSEGGTTAVHYPATA